MAESVLKVISHVGRDILASAASFKTEAAVAWEYVANSLEYVDRGVSPAVHVRVGRSEMTISDNGRGMDEEGLRHFFTMHAENPDRRAGRPGRGKWGTGKSAAFGIANRLLVDTVRNRVRNVAELTRDAINASDGSEIPVTWLVRNESVDAPAGTTVTITDLQVRVDTASIIEYTERHLAFFGSANPLVAVNNHVCEYHQPQKAKTYRFHPTPSQAATIGDVELVVHVAAAPLKDFEQGIAVTAGPGNLVGVERAGIERKEFGSYLFGELDVPNLEKPSAVAPYDSTRNLQLNPKHPVVAVLVGFIGARLEQVRGELVEEQRTARQTEQARRLTEESDKIAEVLNEDFRALQKKLREIRSATAGAGTAGALFGGANEGDDDEGVWVEGVDQPGVLVGSGRSKVGRGTGRPAPDLVRAGTPDADGTDSVSPVGGEGSRTRPRGGFKVDFKHLGADEDRSAFDENTLTININLDHPTVAAALAGADTDSLTFRRLSYEIAFAEYAIALGYQMTEHDPDMPADDLLYEVRSTINRIARASANLYGA